VDEVKPRKPHRLHGAGGGADVSRMLRFHQHHAHLVQLVLHRDSLDPFAARTRAAPFPVFYAPCFPVLSKIQVPLMHPMLNIGVRAARRAGDIIVRSLDRVADLRVETKAGNDFVSEVDREAERAIIETIRRSYPDHAFLGEESGKSGHSEFEWIIDPLDGT